MLVRFTCPSCGRTHSFDMPETTIHMTCGRTGQSVELRLTPGGDVKSRLLGEEGSAATTDKKK